MSADHYYSMLVCENGHVITDEFERSVDDSAYCERCGARTITCCPNCGAKIRGDLVDSGVVVFGYMKSAPKYCPECGEAYPWTASALESIEEIARLDESLNSEEIDDLVSSTKDAMSENPNTKLATLRIKRVLGKCGTTTASFLRDIMVDVLAETAKRSIWPS